MILQFFGKIGEEIVIQDAGDAEEKAHINIVTAEDIIHIGAVAGYLVGKPCDRPALTAEFCLDNMTDMYFFHT